MSRKSMLAGAVIVVVAVVAAVSVFSGPNYSGSASGKSQVGVISIDGVITGGESSGFIQVLSGSDAIMREIRDAAADPSVKAVILRINSPGGSVPATQEIGRELEKLKQKKPVVTSMGEMAASGGFWLAVMTDKIYAEPGTMTGSIGVRMDYQNLEELYAKLGIRSEVIKSGPYKDLGSSTRELKPEERDILQGMVDQMFGEFVDVVAAGRKVPRARVEELADGRVWTGQQAKDLGMVDEIGNFYDAVDGAAKMVGIKGEPSLKYFNRANPLESLFSGAGEKLDYDAILEQVKTFLNQPGNFPRLISVPEALVEAGGA